MHKNNKKAKEKNCSCCLVLVYRSICVIGPIQRSYLLERGVPYAYCTQTRECDVVMRTVTLVCLSVCPIRAVTFERLDLQTSFSVSRHLFRTTGLDRVSTSWGQSRSRPSVTKYTHLRWSAIDSKEILFIFNFHLL